MSWRILIIGALAITPLIAILASGFGNNPHAVPSVLGGRVAPEFALMDLHGKQVRLADYVGKPVVINFWSTWCKPCKVEHNVLQRGAQAYGDQVQFLGVIYHDDANKAESYLSRRLNHYPQLVDPKSLVALDYGVAGVPETFFVNAQGNVSYKATGPVSPRLLAMQVEKMLQGVSE